MSGQITIPKEKIRLHLVQAKRALEEARMLTEPRGYKQAIDKAISNIEKIMAGIAQLGGEEHAK